MTPFKYGWDYWQPWLHRHSRLRRRDARLGTKEQPSRFLINEVALSESDAKEEVERYTYRAPGQAAATSTAI
jgi:hypothetical protein